MGHRVKKGSSKEGFAFLLFTGVTQAPKSVPSTWRMCDRYLLSEGKNQKATREASAEPANNCSTHGLAA